MIKKNNLTQEETEDIIRNICEENNYFFDYPVAIKNHWKIWEIIANNNMLDYNAWVIIAKYNREIIDHGFLIAMSKEKALEITQSVCQQNNWLHGGGGRCHIRSCSSTEWSIGFVALAPNAKFLLNVSMMINTWIVVSKKNGQVLHIAQAPR
jgi:hypothetical protein